MSVSASISNPQNEEERSFYQPVSVESFFYSHWLAGAESLGLDWIKLFATGVSIAKEYIPDVIDELNQLKTWAIDNVEDGSLEYMVERIDILTTTLPTLMTRDDIEIYIG